ncbi:MAG: thiamine biosynthesis lipoprotein [Flavobacteriales bacterium]|jgi:thiamine biosynthesis lipoprotein
MNKLFPLVGLFFLMLSCQQDKLSYKTITGYAQGTTYQITYQDTLQRDFSAAIDSILIHYDFALSNYNPHSTLQAFNTPDSVITVLDTFGYFSDVLLQSTLLHHKTDGAFNPAVWPLVQAWGFGVKQKTNISKQHIDSLLPLTHMENNQHELRVTTEGLLLTYHKLANQTFDFNAIAQGHSVDVVFDFLAQKGIQDLMVEIGGELRAKGRNKLGEFWKLGIDKPLENNSQRTLEAIVAIDNAALATSGNYRKFKIIDGKKYAHTIDPETGRPVTHQLLSATVLAKTAAQADGMATAFMVMGMEKSKSFLDTHPNINLEVFLIESDANGYKTFTSPGMESIMELVK